MIPTHGPRRCLIVLTLVAAGFAVPPVAHAQVPLELLHVFSGDPDGAQPTAALIIGSDGNFYGTTSGGGAYGFGTVFKSTPTGDETVLHAFAGGTDGAVPRAALLQASDGALYGTTVVGGDAGMGTIFKMTLDGAMTVLHAFAGGSDGRYPVAALIQATDGYFYGTTSAGGASDLGTVFRMAPDGTVVVLHSFTGTPNNGFPICVSTDGATPESALLQASDGTFYGTTVNGGGCPTYLPVDRGGIFNITPDGEYTWRYSFSPEAGEHPLGALVQDLDGSLYGTTSTLGTRYPAGPLIYGSGTLFKIDPAGNLTVVYYFGLDNDNLGTSPRAGLIRGADGNFYGTTGDRLYRLAPNGPVSLVYAFADAEGGVSNDGPSAAVVQALDGTFYGTTPGGTLGQGTVYRVDTLMCRDSLDTLSYVSSFISPTYTTVSFWVTLQTPVPATWSVWALTASGLRSLWSVDIPAVPGAVTFQSFLQQIARQGEVTFVTTLSTPAQGVMCFDWKSTNTGSPVVP